MDLDTPFHYVALKSTCTWFGAKDQTSLIGYLKITGIKDSIVPEHITITEK